MLAITYIYLYVCIVINDRDLKGSFFEQYYVYTYLHSLVKPFAALRLESLLIGHHVKKITS